MVAILGANSVSGGYEVSNSLRFNDGDSPKLNRTPSSSGNRKTFTISCWFKRSNISLGDSVDLYSAGQSSGGSGSFSMHILAGDNLRLDANGVVVLQTNRLFRDPSAWYHYVLVVDTTQGTAANRFKMYINGVEETSFATDNRSSISQNTDLRWNMNEGHGVGYNFFDTTYYYDGYITEFHNVDGTAKAQTDFGEFDDNGVWIPKKYTGSYGTNGFFMQFKQTGTSQNSSGIGADTSGNDNHFAVTNLAATDITEDTCTNNFVTLNPITPVVTHTLSEGNCKSTNSSGTHGGTTATINLPTSGKWYWEVKIEAESSDKGQGVGIGNQIYRSASDWGNYPNMVLYLSDGTKQNESGFSSYGNAHNANDIISVAYNADDQELTFYHNNSSQGTIPTSEMDGIIDFDNVSIIVFGRNVTQSFNFGNPPYAISSGNNDGKYGNFEYAPPSGYYALCTKRLAEFG